MTHPIDQAIAAMQTRRHQQELTMRLDAAIKVLEADKDQLRRMCQSAGLKARTTIGKMRWALYCHLIDKPL